MLRLRFGFLYLPSSRIEFGGRVQTRSSRLPSSHVDFGTDLNGKDIGIDHAFARYSWDAGHVWMGKYSFPFWIPNELLWDRDLAPEGVSARHAWRLSRNVVVTGTAAYFLLERSIGGSLLDVTRLAGMQIVLHYRKHDFAVKTSTAFYDYSHNPQTEDFRLGDLNYHIGSSSVLLDYDGWSLPVAVGADLFRNFQEYPPRVINRDDRTAWAIHITAGDIDTPKHWRLKYIYSRVGHHAVASGYARDDRHRVFDDRGGAGNYFGHEVNASIAVTKKVFAALRLTTMSDIRSVDGRGAAGLRIQMDWNMRF